MRSRTSDGVLSVYMPFYISPASFLGGKRSVFLHFLRHPSLQSAASLFSALREGREYLDSRRNDLNPWTFLGRSLWGLAGIQSHRVVVHIYTNANQQLFNEFISKYPNQRWFQTDGGNDIPFDMRPTPKFWDMYKEKFGGPYKLRKRKMEEQGETEEGNAFSGALAKAKKEGKSSFEVDGKTYEVKEGQVYPEKTDDGDFLSNFIKNALKRNTRLYPKKDKEQTMVPKKDYNDFDEYKDDDDDEYSSHMFIGEEGEKDNFIQKATKKMEKKGTSGKFGQWCKKEGLDKDGEVTKKCIDKAMKSDDSKVVKMANFAKNIKGYKGADH